MFKLSRDLIGRRSQRVMQLYGQKLLKVSYQAAEFGGRKYRDTRDIIVLVCHVILEEHVTKRSCDFMDKVTPNDKS